MKVIKQKLEEERFREVEEYFKKQNDQEDITYEEYYKKRYGVKIN